MAFIATQGERSVEDIAAEIGQSVANTSHHLRSLARAGVVTTRRDGTRVFYRLASERVSELWLAMRDVAGAHVADLDQLAAAYLGTRAGVEEITRAELEERLRVGDVIVLDVRPSPEFSAGHIRGARSVPITTLRQHLKTLPAGTDVVAYCRGPYCVYANEAVTELARHFGYHRLAPRALADARVAPRWTPRRRGVVTPRGPTVGTLLVKGAQNPCGTARRNHGSRIFWDAIRALFPESSNPKPRIKAERARSPGPTLQAAGDSGLPTLVSSRRCDRC